MQCPDCRGVGLYVGLGMSPPEPCSRCAGTREIMEAPPSVELTDDPELAYMMRIANAFRSWVREYPIDDGGVPFATPWRLSADVLVPRGSGAALEFDACNILGWRGDEIWPARAALWLRGVGLDEVEVVEFWHRGTRTPSECSALEYAWWHRVLPIDACEHLFPGQRMTVRLRAVGKSNVHVRGTLLVDYPLTRAGREGR